MLLGETDAYAAKRKKVEMHSNYSDILALTDDEPKWYDANGVPRFAVFHPDLRPNIYSRTVVLLMIQCQDCRKRFRVQMQTGIFDHKIDVPPSKWHYGDPPWHDCVGDTMNSEPLIVLECWSRLDVGVEWQRRTDLEGMIE